jgi:hypothetical protein
MSQSSTVIKAGLNNNGDGTENFQNPYWILAVFSYKTCDTFDRGKISSPAVGGFRIVSRKDDETAGSNVDGYLFDCEIKHWQTSQSKDNHIQSFSAAMVNSEGDLSLMEHVNGGDWCMFWAFNNRQDYQRIRRRMIFSYSLRAWTPDKEEDQTRDDSGIVNDWMSGLKFVGKIQSVQHTESRVATGQYNVEYVLQAFGFTELDSLIYYDAAVAFKYPTATQFYQDIGITTDDLLNKSGPDEGFINTNRAIPLLVKTFLGKGPPPAGKGLGTPVDKDKLFAAHIESTPNTQFKVPQVVSMILLGRKVGENYSDVLLQLIGDQTYSSGENEEYKNFVPEFDHIENNSIVFTKRKIIDYFPETLLDFNNQTVWSVIRQFLNEPLNEIYTALKPHPETGLLMPSITVRRTPYSSDTYQKQEGRLQAISFSELPRWAIPDALVISSTIGKSDAPRINYVHILPKTTFASASRADLAQMRVDSPPVVNKVDIQRQGLRATVREVSGFADPTSSSASTAESRRYTEFIADIVMDAHFRYNGSISTVGIQEPVQPGDNIVFNGMLFHIESISHRGGISFDGTKDFETTIQMSHGLPMKVIARDRLTALSASQSDTQKLPQEDTRTTEQILMDLEEELAKFKDPPEDSIRELRNIRESLQLVGLVGAKTRTERE